MTICGFRTIFSLGLSKLGARLLDDVLDDRRIGDS